MRWAVLVAVSVSVVVPGPDVRAGDIVGTVRWTGPVPEPLLGLAVLGLAAVFVAATLRERRNAHDRPAPDGAERHCH